MRQRMLATGLAAVALAIAGCGGDDSPEDAETVGSIAENSGETVVIKGSVVVTIPVDSAAQTDQPKIESCLG